MYWKSVKKKKIKSITFKYILLYIIKIDDIVLRRSYVLSSFLAATKVTKKQKLKTNKIRIYLFDAEVKSDRFQ